MSARISHPYAPSNIRCILNCRIPYLRGMFHIIKNNLLDTKYQLNTDEVKEYFEMNQTINGMFEVYHRLLGISIKETSGLPVWYSKVRSFEMYVGDKKVGSFYFDLYPRQNKYTHFACFGISAANSEWR